MSARSKAPPLLAAVLAIALAACGATPPQAPLTQAKKLDAATGDVSTDCGLAYQLTAFPGDNAKNVAGLETSAIQSANSLASVYRRDKAWIYQGETVEEIVNDAATTLSACGLDRAAGALRRSIESDRS